ncbi:AraC family transcriptional regulator [Rhodopseudomonas pseudopalustris]|uniref:Transcriptional regulator, AraC family n=2 Tax=Rhodopseudomonas TaxID=1073 RepID=Q137V3_RHOPS|nr:AraC family transcriptional regulator [Rhodopseudomonas pseudopalustris]ABE39636.1 transcriptional regulator, AraC family [Rhodopseudomonas palustris BisB5]MBB1092554.1 AraC family transcriptional regulator [Rhodopseudomonas palustris]SEP20269.1 transcriptional regulator, AraC family [Rhodopseudomonas pseudopalustris]
MSDVSSSAIELSYPLNRSPVVHTRNTEEMRHAMINFYGAQAFSAAAEGFEGFGSFVNLDATGFGFCRYAAPAVASFPETDFARLQIALGGSARTSSGASAVDVDQDCMGVSTAGMPSRLEFGAGYEQMVIRFSNAKLMATLEAMLGVRPRGTLVFVPSTRLDHHGARALRDFGMFLAQNVDQEQAPLPPLMLRELEHALMVSFLSVVRHNFSNQLDRDAPDTAPDYVRVAEEYVAASWNRSITITDLAAVTNVGVRSLFKAFQKHRGYSPMAFAKAVRLNKAREMLMQGDPSRSVTSVAFACGFSNLGHFAHDYRQKHGELPSETLARAR